ncbi:MAG: TadG family pilus assembly protein [Phycisphaerae bacterium]
MVRWLQIGRVRGNVAAFLQDQRGSILTIMGFGLVVAAGFTALAVDMSYLYVLKGRLQTTADFAVLAAVTQLPDEDAARTMASEYTAKNMPAANHGTVLANADVVTGNWDADTRTFTPAGDPVNAVRVVTRRSQANGNAAGLFFASILGFDEIDMQTTAIASSEAGDSCIIALDPSVDDALRVAGNVDVTMSCGVRVNSTGSKAIRLAGGGCLTASIISVTGGHIGACISPAPDTDMTPMADPLAYLSPPTDFDDDGCTYTALVEVTTDTTLSPGVYCGGISISDTANVDFEPGNYTVGGEGLEISGSGAVTGDEVMFYIAPTATGIPFHHHQGPGKTVHFAGSANITLSAPTSGDYKDVLIWQDAGVSSDLELVFNGGADMELNGVLYAPNHQLRFAGNGDPGGATSIVARTVELTGNANFGSNPETALFGPGGAGGISLVQ